MKTGILTILFFVLINAGYSQNVITYVGTPEVSGTTSSATDRLSAKLNKPYDMAFDSKGNMWISELGNQTITMVRASDNKVMIRAGIAGTAGFMNGNGTQAKFNSPHGIAVGPNDEIYVADYENHVIRKISPYVDESTPQIVSVYAGKFTTGTGDYTAFPGYAEGASTVAQFNNPIDLVIDATGNLFVSDHGNHVIRKINSSATVSLFAGQPGVAGKTNGDATTQAQFSSPTGLFRYNSLLYVLDYGNKQIRRIDGSTVSRELITLLAYYPMELVYKVEGSTKTFYFTEGNAVKNAYSMPTGSGSGVYAGSLSQSGSADGTLTNARFKTTKGITYGPDGRLYVADMDNHTIRKIMSCPNITPQLTVIGDMKFCLGDSVKFTAPDGYTTYTWSNGASTKEVCIKTSQSIKLTVIDNDGCTLTSATHDVIALLPELEIIGDSILCEGESATIKSAYEYDSYKWSTGETSRSLDVTSNGLYSVELTYKSCVQHSRAIEVVVNDIPDKPTISVDGNNLTSSEAISYQWFRNGKIISTATSRTISVTNSGNFKVEVSNSNGCKNVSDEVYVVGSSIDDQENISINVYPNPSSSIITIESLTNQNSQEIYMYDLNGKLVYQNLMTNPKMTINLASLNIPKGFYLIKVQTDNSIICSRILYK
ncbi:T9SS type A sorting domain-containing protein [Bacteroidota bacterium]